MAASSLLLRSLLLASSHRVPHTASSSIYRSSFLHFRAEFLNLRGSYLACRSLSAEALQVSEPVSDTRSFKKKKSPSSSWDEAGAAFFSDKNAKNAAENGGSVALNEGRAGFSASESPRSRSRQSNEEERPMANKNFERNRDRGMVEGKFGNTRNTNRDFRRGREEFTSRNKGEDRGFSRREPADMISSKGAHRERGFRESFSNDGDGGSKTRWNSRNDTESRGAHHRGNFRAGGFRDGASESRGPARQDFRSGGFRSEAYDRYGSEKSGAFRKEFGESVDTSKGYFQNRDQGGTRGKRQFRDVDGGKWLSKGKSQGDGFVKKQIGESDNSRSSFGSPRSGQRESPRTHLQRQSEAEEEVDISLEDDDEDEDLPQAGDVIRYSEMSNMAKEGNQNRKQSPVNVDDTKDEFQEDEDEDEEDEGDHEAEVESGQVSIDLEGKDAWKEPSAMSLPLPQIKGEVVYGVGPVYAALKVLRREFFCLYVQQNMPIGGGKAGKKKDKKAVEWIIRTAVDRGLDVKEVPKHDLNMLADNRPHQGLILDASPLELVVSTHLEEPYSVNGKTPVWVALDEVTDPQNFGAILRSAYFLGAAGVVICAKNSAPLSAVVSKASAGALEVMELRSCKNMMKFLDRSAENGWRVVGGAAPGADVSPVNELPRGLPTILVLGGEGKGLRTNVKRACEKLVCIPGLAWESNGKKGSPKSKKDEALADVDGEKEDDGKFLRSSREGFIAVDSLNVSVAAGVLLHELLREHADVESVSLIEAVPHDEEPHFGIEAGVVSTTKKEQISEIDVEPAISKEEFVEVVVTDEAAGEVAELGKVYAEVAAVD